MSVLVNGQPQDRDDLISWRIESGRSWRLFGERGNAQVCVRAGGEIVILIALE